MSDRISVACTPPREYTHKIQSDQRLKAGIAKFRKALALDARAAATRGSGLPKDWRSRIIK